MLHVVPDVRPHAVNAMVPVGDDLAAEGHAQALHLLHQRLALGRVKLLRLLLIEQVELAQAEARPVANAIADKMIRRHPHVFGDAQINSAEAQTLAWEEQKASERKAAAAARPSSALDGVAVGLPALTRAEKLQKRAARLGFDWPSAAPVVGKIAEELDEIAAEIKAGSGHAPLHDEVGDLLFAAVNLARHLKIDPESALRGANAKFERRFRSMEARLHSQPADMSTIGAERWEELWQLAKTDS